MELVLYTKMSCSCSICLLTKSEINRLGLEVELVNVEEDLEARRSLFKKLFMSLPVLEVRSTKLKSDGNVSKIQEWYGDIYEILEVINKMGRKIKK